MVIRYLLVAGQTPCFDCWEEHPGNVHTSSLAAVAAGLRDAGRMLGHDSAIAAADQITARVTGPEHTLGGAFIRFPGDTRVDGSLLWLAVPFGLVEVTDPTFVNTVTRIQQELVVPGGGVRRYLGDTFYGGSEWILLAASLGWVQTQRGDTATGAAMLDWIEAAATVDGMLPEQVQDHVQSPYMLQFWRAKWGPDRHALAVVSCDARRAQRRMPPRLGLSGSKGRLTAVRT